MPRATVAKAAAGSTSVSDGGAAPASTAAAVLRVNLPLTDLQPQFAAYLATPTRARGYPPYAGQHALLVEVAPALAVHRATALALQAAPELEVGILFVERQFGVLEIHGDDPAAIETAAAAVVAGLGLVATEPLSPQLLYLDVIENLADQHAVILNRTRQASMVLPGESLLIAEVSPALYAAMLANEAEKAAAVKLVDLEMIGFAGRLYLAGEATELASARSAIVAAMDAVH